MKESDMERIAREAGVKVKAKRVDHNPIMLEGMADGSSHWLIQLQDGSGETHRLHFSQGYGYEDEIPGLSLVLSAIVDEIASLRQAQDYDSWLKSSGAVDTEAARKAYEKIVATDRFLQGALGDYLDSLLVERQDLDTSLSRTL